MPDDPNTSRLKSFVERIERMNEEISGLNEDRREIFAEAKEAGFSIKVMRMIIKERKLSQDDLDELEAMLDSYRKALGMLGGTPLGEAALKKAGGKKASAAEAQVAGNA
jgi:uncharacterized protein (UPF0335 family)